VPKLIPSFGRKDAKIAIIGEAPGRVEMLKGEPFVGPAGEMLNQLLHQAGCSRRDCYITNVFKQEVRKDRSRSKYYIGKDLVYDTRKGFTAEGMKHVKALQEELKDVTSNILVPLGKPALEAITGESKIMKFRGSIMEATEDFDRRKVVSSVHPSAALQQYLLRYMIILI